MKLNGVEFHGKKLIVEEAKTPRNNLQQQNLIKSYNLLESLPNIPPSKPANPTISNADQPLIQNVKSLHSDAIMTNKKDIVLRPAC